MSLLLSCKKDDKVVPNLRPRMDYASVSATANYADQFKDANGASTVDLTNGNNRNKMFQAINTYAGTATTAKVDAAVLKNMFSNTGSPFTGTNASLNSASVQLRNVTASSRPAAEADVVRSKMETNFNDMATISASNAVTASRVLPASWERVWSMQKGWRQHRSFKSHSSGRCNMTT
ncbi:MAG: DUF4856 domain-containing protein [Bacteroidota bacterium]